MDALSTILDLLDRSSDNFGPGARAQLHATLLRLVRGTLSDSVAVLLAASHPQAPSDPGGMRRTAAELAATLDPSPPMRRAYTRRLLRAYGAAHVLVFDS